MNIPRLFFHGIFIFSWFLIFQVMITVFIERNRPFFMRPRMINLNFPVLDFHKNKHYTQKTNHSKACKKFDEIYKMK